MSMLNWKMDWNGGMDYGMDYGIIKNACFSKQYPICSARPSV